MRKSKTAEFVLLLKYHIHQRPPKLVTLPTYQQVRQTCDTIFALTANPIFGKLQFYVIISSTIDPKLKRSLFRIAKRNLRILANAGKWRFHHPWRSLYV